MYGVTIFIPITRRDRINDIVQIVSCLDTNDCEVSILSIIDNSDISPLQLVDKCRRAGIRYPIKTVSTNRDAPGEFNPGMRRARITEVFNMVKENVKSQRFLFVFEDDCEIKPDYLQRLLALYLQYPSAGFVSGVQVGRWGYRMLGCWKCDNPAGPQKLCTLPYKSEKGIEEADACGFYCMLTRFDLFSKVTHVYGDFGPDVFYGLQLRKMGYTNYIDRSIEVGHAVNGGILYPDEKVVSLEYFKTQNGWKRVKQT